MISTIRKIFGFHNGFDSLLTEEEKEIESSFKLINSLYKTSSNKSNAKIQYKFSCPLEEVESYKNFIASVGALNRNIKTTVRYNKNKNLFTVTFSYDK